MEFTIFGNKVTIGKKADNSEYSKNFINVMESRGYQYVGNDITSCGKIRIDLRTMYEVHKKNKMAFAYTQKITQMVAAKGFTIVDEEDREIDTQQAKAWLAQLYSYIGYRHELGRFKLEFFNQLFPSGQVFACPTRINGLGLIASEQDYIRILDSRGMLIETDAYYNPIKYVYSSIGGGEVFTPSQLVDYIGYLDVDYKYKGLPLYTSVVIDALTNNEAARTQMYFFKNNAQPNLFIMLNPEAFKGENGPETKKQFDAEWNRKYGGSDNAGKIHSSYMATDIKTLDISNVDLDLINLRKENDNSLSVVFMLDSRLIGLSKETGSYGEIESTTIRQGNEQIEAYGIMYSDFITDVYKKFINPDFEFYIKAVNAKFKNENKDKEIAIREREKGLLTPNEYRKTFGLGEAEADGMDEYTVIGGGLTVVNETGATK